MQRECRPAIKVMIKALVQDTASRAHPAIRICNVELSARINCTKC